MTASVDADSPPVPRYGEASLSDVMPSVLAALEAGGENRLGLDQTQRVVVMLVDGMGLRGLQAHADAAPYLSSLSVRELTAGFPSTTVTSLASLSTGVPAGQHAMTGYTSYMADVDEAVNWLAWRPVGKGGEDLRDRLVPEVVQPEPTMWQRATEAGIAVSIVSSNTFDGSGLTRAVFRGGGYAGTTMSGDAVAIAADLADRGHRSLVYAYASELDFVGHVRGPASDAWVAQLALIDKQVELLAARLPAGTTLYVTADHGMTVLGDDVLDADVEGSPLRQGVRALAGEPRMRHVHAEPGAAADVLATWREVVGDRAWVMSGDDAIAAGLFGPVVSAVARARIGDVVAIARDGFAVLQRSRESLFSNLVGHHGSLTDDELLIPLLSTQL